jgi:hypothetical protein
VIRNRPLLQRSAALAAIAVLGLMLTAAGRLIMDGPVMQQIVASLPWDGFGFGRGESAAPANAAQDAQVENSADSAQELASAALGGAEAVDSGDMAEAAGVGSAPLPGTSKALAQPELGATTPPLISLTKTRVSQDPASVGDTVVFSIELHNAGALSLSGLYLADDYEAEYLRFDSADPPPSAVDPDAGTLTWTDLESMLADQRFDPGETLVFELRFEAIAATAGARTLNQARAGARENNVEDGPVGDDLEIVEIAEPVALCLGDLVFIEMIDDARYDPAQGDLGAAGVDLSLYSDDGSGRLDAGDQLVATTTSDASGHYRFCGLAAGDYIVAVDPSNFSRSAALALLVSSTGFSGAAPAALVLDEGGDPNDDRDNDDNGAATGAGGRVATAAIRLAPGTEPGVEVDGDDANSNLTLDLGFVLSRSDIPNPPDVGLPPAVLAPPGGSLAPPAGSLDQPDPNGRRPGKPVRYEGPIRGKPHRP